MPARQLKELIQLTPAAFVGLVSNFDPDWIHLALCLVEHGGARLRRRKLPVDVALWLVIGIALFRDRSIHEVVQHLELVLEDSTGERACSRGALPAARHRLGHEAVELLFRLSADCWSEPTPEDRWRGLSVWAADGTCFNAPNSRENEEAFGRPSNGKTVGGFPQVRAMMLMNAFTHVMKDFSLGAYREGELSLLKPMWDQLPEHSLVLLDRGLQSWWDYRALTKSGSEKHWATLAKSSFSCRVVKKLGRGDALVEVALSAKSRQGPAGCDETSMQMRRINVCRRGYKPQQVLTSLLDSEKFPASEMAQLYGRRWEIENAYDEIKTELLDRKDVLRSQSPAGIRQELYGIAVAFNLVRRELARVAAAKGLSPLELSFRHAVVLIRNFLVAAPSVAQGAIPRRLASLERDLALLRLPKRRKRRCRRETINRRRRHPPKKRAAAALSDRH